MNLKWDNIALIVAAIALIYVVKRGPYGFFQPTVYYPPASETYNLCVIALLCITVIGIVKLLTRQNRPGS